MCFAISYFPEPYTCNKIKIKVKLDLSSYTTKPDLKNATSVDKSKFAKNANLAVLKREFDRLGINKLKTNPVHFGYKSLKEPRNYDRKLFFCPPQKQAKTQPKSTRRFPQQIYTLSIKPNT